MGITPPEFLASLRSAHAQDHLAEGISRPHHYLARADTPMRLIGRMGKGATGSFTAE